MVVLHGLMHPRLWTQLDRNGLFVKPGEFYIDPDRAVRWAVITHGHADHARRGHHTVVATPETLAIMECRYGKHFCTNAIPLGIHESMTIGDTTVSFYPAGHVLGSVQVQVVYKGQRFAVSGDYKRGGGDPSCADFEPVPCDVFLTEATFGYPLFVFPNPWNELEKFVASTQLFPERPHLLAAYSLGKSQRLIASLRKLGWKGRIYAHSTIVALNAVYQRFGIELGTVFPLEQYHYDETSEIADIIIAPQGGDLKLDLPQGVIPVLSGASGWNSVRKHALSSRLEVPMVMSDHCDWVGLQESIRETGAKEVWVTHGPADALSLWGKSEGLNILDLKEVWRG